MSSGLGKPAAIVYVPGDDYPGAIRPTGTYAVKGDDVSVRLTLRKDGAEVARVTVEGKKTDLKGLAAKMAEAILKAAK